MKWKKVRKCSAGNLGRSRRMIEYLPAELLDVGGEETAAV